MILLKAFYESDPTLSVLNKYVYTQLAPDASTGHFPHDRNLHACCGFIAAVIEAGHTGDELEVEEINDLINSAFPTLQDYLRKFFKRVNTLFKVFYLLLLLHVFFQMTHPSRILIQCQLQFHMKSSTWLYASC